MNDDITAGYIIADVERLRIPMQQISEFLLKSMGLLKSGELVSFLESFEPLNDSMIL